MKFQKIFFFFSIFFSFFFFFFFFGGGGGVGSWGPGCGVRVDVNGEVKFL